MKFFDKVVCVILLLVLALLPSCKKKELTRPLTDDFEVLSGKGLPAWDYVQTGQDFEYLSLFKGIYEKGKVFLQDSAAQERIPKTIHFIWLGPKPFPRESVENVRSWMAKHPSWTVKFWTDRERPLPCPGMQIASVKDWQWLNLARCYSDSDNYAEKSDVLRYEILYKEGGIYVDHDVKCFKSFDLLNTAYDFYCGIDMPFRSSLPSCIFPTNNLIGARAGHPILMHCMQTLVDQWDRIGEDYPGADRDSMLNRVLHRTFWIFGESIKQAGNQNEMRDIVFPAYYFDAPDDRLALWSRHQYAGLWHETESAFEKMVRQRLMLLSKKSNKMLLFFGVMSILNLVGFIVLVAMVRKQRKYSL